MSSRLDKCFEQAGSFLEVTVPSILHRWWPLTYDGFPVGIHGFGALASFPGCATN